MNRQLKLKMFKALAYGGSLLKTHLHAQFRTAFWHYVFAVYWLTWKRTRVRCTFIGRGKTKFKVGQPNRPCKLILILSLTLLSNDWVETRKNLLMCLCRPFWLSRLIQLVKKKKDLFPVYRPVPGLETVSSHTFNRCCNCKPGLPK